MFIVFLYGGSLGFSELETAIYSWMKYTAWNQSWQSLALFLTGLRRLEPEPDSKKSWAAGNGEGGC